MTHLNNQHSYSIWDHSNSLLVIKTIQVVPHLKIIIKNRNERNQMFDFDLNKIWNVWCEFLNTSISNPFPIWTMKIRNQLRNILTHFHPINIYKIKQNSKILKISGFCSSSDFLETKNKRFLCNSGAQKFLAG